MTGSLSLRVKVECLRGKQENSVGKQSNVHKGYMLANFCDSFLCFPVKFFSITKLYCG
jgi:hypothetical protein